MGLKSTSSSHAKALEIGELIKIAHDVLDTRSSLEVDLNSNGAEDKDVMLALLSVGAGGVSDFYSLINIELPIKRCRF